MSPPILGCSTIGSLHLPVKQKVVGSNPTTPAKSMGVIMEKLTEWTIQDCLKTKKNMADYLRAALEENSFSYLKIAVSDVITALETKRAKNVKAV